MPEILLPIGISFFVFQGVSYVIDVYRREVAASGSFMNTALYISLFPQLIAGPIVRYSDVASQIITRKISLAGYGEGLTRFCFGMGKKVLLANPAGTIADIAFSQQDAALTLPLAWLGALAYTVQIYFDFSGYSDMAIGLGRVLGFRFPENFNYPYIAASVTEFWRRWHISLSSWFKDYLYIPLGGNRKGATRTRINLLIVFSLTGLWHGAAMNFLVWGLWHGFFMLLEKYAASRKPVYCPAFLKHGYCLLAVITGWVFFRADSISTACRYLKCMFNPFRLEWDMIFLAQLDLKNLLVFAAAILVGTGMGRSLCFAPYLGKCFALAILGLSYVCLVSSTYNPFIYFRF